MEENCENKSHFAILKKIILFIELLSYTHTHIYVCVCVCV